MPCRSRFLQSTACTSDLFSSVVLPPVFCVCGSDAREKYVISLTWNATEAKWSASCQSSVIIFPNVATGRSGCLTVGDRLGERWYAKWRHGVSSRERGGMSSGVRVGAATCTHRTGICCAVRLSHSCVRARVCVRA